MIEIKREPWESVWPEVNDLAMEHFLEVDGGVEPRRVLKIDSRRMALMSTVGILWIWAAREPSGRMIGYLSFNVIPDVESEGLISGIQGAWFVSRSARSTNVGWRLMRRAIAEMKLQGVHLIQLHHRMQGRGSELGRFFKSLGAKHTKQEYQLWIGD